MNLISVDKVTGQAGDKVLFENVSFGIDSSDKLALIGVNGCGKSTLIKMLAGQWDCEEGKIARNNDLKVSWLEQTPQYSKGQKIVEYIFNTESPIMSLIREYERCLAILAGEEGLEPTRDMDVLMDEMDKSDAWTLESRFESILSELGISDTQLKMESLSGGMQKKVSIAKCLVQEADLIFLDEPTNHLDIDTIQWLEGYLKATRQAVVLVTHDRYFLEAICTRILEVADQKVFQYKGNYSTYLAEKELREITHQNEQDRLKSILRMEYEWIKRGPRARASKDKKRQSNYYNMMDKVTTAEMGSSEFSVSNRRLGGKILELENITKSYGDHHVVNPFSYKFKKAERIGIIGANGSGKSTFLNLLAMRTECDSGTVVAGVNTHIGYFDQTSVKMPHDERVMDYVKETAEIITLDDGSSLSPSQFLERFLFPKALFYTTIGNLSGGEKRRLYLLKVLLENPNFLILDEPTNDFDIQTLSLLENFLQQFQGCLIVVSHDRYFLDRTTDFLFVLDGEGNISGFGGTITEYLDFRAEQAKEKKLAASAENARRAEENKANANKQKQGLSFKEKFELEEIEDKLMGLEDEKSELESFFETVSDDADLIKKNQIRYSQLDTLIEETMERWEYLESKKA